MINIKVFRGCGGHTRNPPQSIAKDSSDLSYRHRTIPAWDAVNKLDHRSGRPADGVKTHDRASQGPYRPPALRGERQNSVAVAPGNEPLHSHVSDVQFLPDNQPATDVVRASAAGTTPSDPPPQPPPETPPETPFTCPVDAHCGSFRPYVDRPLFAAGRRSP